MSWWAWLLLGGLLGWEAHWYFKLRPFARDVERRAVELQALVAAQRVRDDAAKTEVLAALESLEAQMLGPR